MHDRTSPQPKDALKSTTMLSASNKPPDNHDHLLREEEAARFLGLSPRTMQQWRYKGNGPEHVRLSRRAIRYRMQDLMDFIEKLKNRNTI